MLVIYLNTVGINYKNGYEEKEKSVKKEMFTKRNGLDTKGSVLGWGTNELC